MLTTATEFTTLTLLSLTLLGRTSNNMDLLGGSDSDADEKVEFKINKKYAKGYQVWRSKEEKQKLIDRYGDVGDDSSSSSEEEEIRTTKQMDKDWLRTYAVVHFKQPRLYKEGEKFFHDEAKPVSKKKEKATTLKDYERNFLLEKGGIASEDEEAPKPQGKSYYEEQEEIKKSFQDAVGDSSSEEEGDELLVKRPKTKEEQAKEENEYLEWLKGKRENLDDEEAEKELAPLKAYWNDPNLSEKERVLRDYVLNNGYMDQDDSEESDESEGPDPDDEEEFLEKADEYEHKYNFRHEEPGGDEIKSYPRVIEESVRNKDTRRIEKRQRRMEKKRMEKEERNEEIRLLQKLHREERQEKMDKLRETAKNPDLDYDLEADFNPEEHDKIMQSYFGTNYYGDEAGTLEKPEFEYDAAIDDQQDDYWDKRLKEEEGMDGEYDGEDEYDGTNFNMDADYDPNEDTTSGKKKKKKLKNEKKKKKKKLPLFDPTTKTFDEYIEEYLKDKIGTLPFTYREVLPNNYGLTTEEILKAPEKELNAWVSVKQMSQYRSNAEEQAEKRKFVSRAQQPGKKSKVIPSLLKKEEESKPKKKKKKKAKSKQDKTEKSEDADTDDHGSSGSEMDIASTSQLVGNGDSSIHKPKVVSSPDVQKKKKKRKKSEQSSVDDVTEEPAQKKSKPNKTSSPGQVKKQMSAGQLNRQTSAGQLQQVKSGELNEKKKQKSKEKGKKLSSPEKSSPLKSPGTVKAKSNLDMSQSTGKQTIKNSKPSTPKQAKNLGESLGETKKKKNKKKQEADSGTKPGSESDLKDLLKVSSPAIANTTKSPLKKTEPSLGESKAQLTKKKKKKMSISNFGKSAEKSGGAGGENKKKLQHKLSQMMSASRLSKFGLGPDAAKSTKKRKKKGAAKF